MFENSMDFRNWLESNYPSPVNFFGKPVSSDEDAVELTRKWWRDKGYSPEEIKEIEVAVDNDQKANVSSHAFPDMMKNPFLQKAHHMLGIVLQNSEERKRIWQIIFQDEYTKLLFRQMLLKPDVTPADAENLINVYQRLGVYEKAKEIPHNSNYPKTVIQKTNLAPKR